MKLHITLTKDDVLDVIKTPEYFPLVHTLSDDQLSGLARKIESQLFLAENGASAKVVMYLVINNFMEKFASMDVTVRFAVSSYVYAHITAEAKKRGWTTTQWLQEVVKEKITPPYSAIIPKEKSKKAPRISYWHDKIDFIKIKLAEGASRATIARAHDKSVGSLKGFIRRHIKSKN